ncbi:MAG: hypothetical protein IH906_03560 [Proteobacteria bacterium]|nr:hypothetical protein [Pseudomonadota bacterium]
MDTIRVVGQAKYPAGPARAAVRRPRGARTARAAEFANAAAQPAISIARIRKTSPEMTFSSLGQYDFPFSWYCFTAKKQIAIHSVNAYCFTA